MSIVLRWCLVLGLVLAPSACDDGDGPVDLDGGPLDVSGTYAATFTSTSATGCGALVPLDSTTGNLVVVQSGTAVTLLISGLSENIQSDPTGTIDADGNFTFEGPLAVGNASGTIDAQGTITGSFTRAGRVDLDFAFTAFTCEVEGTIAGQA